jgi:GAF domain-containing protein
MQSPSEPSRPKALNILLEASALLLHAGSEEVLLSQILDLASNLLVADAYGVWRESEDRLVWRVIAQRGLSHTYPKTFELDAKTLPPGVWFVEDMAKDGRVVFQKSIYEREGIRSAMIVPWVVDATTNGAIIYYWRNPRQFSPDDVDYALALSNLSASALNRLELNEQNRREKQRLAFLAEASATLASSLDYESTLERVARLAVSYMADWCTVHVAENGKLARLVVAHADPNMSAFAEEYERRYPEQIEPSQGVGKVFSTGEPEIVPVITQASPATTSVELKYCLSS